MVGNDGYRMIGTSGLIMFDHGTFLSHSIAPVTCFNDSGQLEPRGATDGAVAFEPGANCFKQLVSETSHLDVHSQRL